MVERRSKESLAPGVVPVNKTPCQLLYATFYALAAFHLEADCR